MTRRYLVTDKSGAPTGIVDADLITDQAMALACALAAAADDEDRCVTIAGDLLEKVGSVEFGHICSSALLTMAVDIIGPLLDATDAAGIRLRTGIRSPTPAPRPGRPEMTTSQDTSQDTHTRGHIDPKDQT